MVGDSAVVTESRPVCIARTTIAYHESRNLAVVSTRIPAVTFRVSTLPSFYRIISESHLDERDQRFTCR